MKKRFRKSLALYSESDEADIPLAPLQATPPTLSPSSTASPSEVQLIPDVKEMIRQNSQSSDLSLKRPTVHYPEELEHAAAAQCFNTSPKLESRAPSFAGTDDEEDFEEDFDWSGDEDLEDQEAMFEKQTGINIKSRRWTIWRLLTLLFSSLIGSIFLAGVLVTPAVLVHFFWYKPYPTAYRHYVDLNVEAWLFWAAANVVVSWGLAMSVDIIPAIARLLISISWGHVSEEVKSHVELYDSIKDTFKPVLYAASAWLSWIILFQNIFKLYHNGPDGSSYATYTDRVAQAIEFLFFLTLVICAQRMLSHAIAFAFHRTAYRERLDDLKLALRVIEKLRAYKPKSRHQHRPSTALNMFNLGFISPFSEKETNHGSRSESVSNGYEAGVDNGIEEEADNKKTKGKSRRTIGQISSPSNSAQETHEIVSHEYPPSRKRAGDQHAHDEHNPAVHAARVLKSAVLHDARNIIGEDHDLSVLGFSVNSTYEAKRLARAIYTTFRDRHRSYLIAGDFRPAFSSVEEAQEAFRVFDKDNNGDISRSEIKSVILRVYKERRFLSRSMRDVGAALKTLNQILLFFALVILFFISLSVFGVDVTQSLTSVYSLGIAASFIFKNTASNVFDAIMFLFVTHPFDTGDRCFIDSDNLVVKKMGLFATVFVRSDGTETYYSNSQLFTKFITNARRSDKMTESLAMQVAWRTPLEKLDALQARINEWLATEENRWFQPTTSVSLQNIVFQRHLEITIGIPYNSTWQDWGSRGTRRTAFHAAVQYYCQQLGITAYLSPMPIVYVDPDTQQVPLVVDTEPRYADSSWNFGGEGSPKSFLGFTPPDQRASKSLRARKSKSHKAALRGIGADSG